MAITTGGELLVLGVALWASWAAWRRWELDAFLVCVIFYGVFVLATLALLRLMLSVCPLRPGIYTARNGPRTYVGLMAYSFIAFVNLYPLWILGLIPFVLRKPFYRFLGARFGPGIIPIAGLITDPYLTTIEQACVIGYGAVIMGHAQTPAHCHSFILGEVTLKRGAMIGGNALIMPSVTVGEYAMVNAGSVVAMGTKIGPYEVWGGNPAKKLSVLRAGTESSR